MKKEKIVKFFTENKGIICILALFAFLTYFFPYTGDDWTWGGSVGINRLSSLFVNYNGRYAGNILVILLTRSNLLRIVFTSCTYIMILVLVYKIVTPNKQKVIFYLAVILFFIMPRTIFSETVVWTSGFSNYGMPILFLLVYLYSNKDINVGYSNFNKVVSFLFLFLGFIGGLFMENITIYNLIISFLFIIYSLIKYKKVSAYNMLFFIGTVLSTILMFSNGAYGKIASNNDFYRTISNNYILRAYDNYFNIIYKGLVQENLLINVLISGTVLLLLVNWYKKNKSKKTLFFSLSVIPLSYSSYCIFKMLNPSWEIALKYTNLFEGIFALIFIFSLFIIPIFIIERRAIKEKAAFLIFSYILIIAPLLLVTPISPRAFLPSYIILLMYFLVLIDHNLGNGKRINHLILKSGAVVFGIFLFLYYLSIYAYVHKYYLIREETMRKESARGVEVIIIPDLPYKEFIHFSKPINNKFWNNAFKNFYDVDSKVKVNIISIKDWKKRHKK